LNWHEVNVEVQTKEPRSGVMARHFFMLSVALVALSAAAAIDVTRPALGQTPLKFSLDWKYEGTQAPTLHRITIVVVAVGCHRRKPGRKD
jgi:hypothetical protein